MKKFFLFLLLPLFFISCSKEPTVVELPESLANTWWKTVAAEETNIFDHAKIEFWGSDNYTLWAQDKGEDLIELSSGTYRYNTDTGIIELRSTNSVLSGRVANLTTLKLQIYDEEVEGDSEILPLTFEYQGVLPQ